MKSNRPADEDNESVPESERSGKRNRPREKSRVMLENYQKISKSLQLFAELRARIIFFLEIDVFTNTPLLSSVFIRLP
jgi:hypothetical protein